MKSCQEVCYDVSIVDALNKTHIFVICKVMKLYQEVCYDVPNNNSLIVV